ncbi:MAG: nicotinate-nucleotide adenylyltransferase [Lachnospiraceae bacterium]|nr:nicotinate-nucleotide adenylyltransferase [Lachnospiraceae bacterium]
MKIVIMGGTFNPIHNGHLLLAETAKKEGNLDKIWFMPSGLPAHKSNSELISSEHRLAMVQLAVNGIADYFASSYEIDRPGFTYTADTMEGLSNEFPEYEFYFIIGGDSLMKFHHWVKPEVISKHTSLLAAGRNGYSLEDLQKQAENLYHLFGTKVTLISMPELNISSNEIRNCIKHNPESIRKDIPESVYNYILEHQLYL